MQLHTKHVIVNVPFDSTFDYVANPNMLAEWATNFIKDIKISADGMHKVKTPFGESTLNLRTDKKLGTVDHVFNPGTPNESIVCTRVIAMGPESSAYVFSLPLPTMPKEQLDLALAGLAEELFAVKANLEKIQEAVTA